MANVGHKAVMARELGELFRPWTRPGQTGARAPGPGGLDRRGRTLRHLLARPRRPAPPGRAPGAPRPLLAGPAGPGAGAPGRSAIRAWWTSWTASPGGCATAPAAATCWPSWPWPRRRSSWTPAGTWKGKTSWNFVYLAHLARRSAAEGALAPEAWVQAAALVNLFPTDEAEDRPRPEPPRVPAPDPPTGLLDAILDAEPQQAMFHAGAAGGRGPPGRPAADPGRGRRHERPGLQPQPPAPGRGRRRRPPGAPAGTRSAGPAGGPGQEPSPTARAARTWGRGPTRPWGGIC